MGGRLCGTDVSDCLTEASRVRIYRESMEFWFRISLFAHPTSQPPLIQQVSFGNSNPAPVVTLFCLSILLNRDVERHLLISRHIRHEFEEREHTLVRLHHDAFRKAFFPGRIAIAAEILAAREGRVDGFGGEEVGTRALERSVLRRACTDREYLGKRETHLPPKVNEIRIFGLRRRPMIPGADGNSLHSPLPLPPC